MTEDKDPRDSAVLTNDSEGQTIDREREIREEIGGTSTKKAFAAFGGESGNPNEPTDPSSI